MANLLTSLFLRRRSDDVVRLTTNDYLRWLTSNARYGLLGGGWSNYTTYRGKPTERIENSFTGYVSGAYKSDPIVFACMTKRSSVFSEARFLWRKIEKDGATGDFFADDALSVLAKPWPNGTTGELLTRMIQDVDLAGNFYAVNEGDRLRRLRPDWVQIVLSGDPRVDADVDVLGYVFTAGGPDGGGTTKAYLPEEICHWSPITDPDAQYRGMSWLTPVVREIQGDHAATDHKLAFFRNGATLGPIIKVPAGLTPQQFKEFIEADQQAHAGVENAYRNMYVGGGADVTLGMATMQQMDFKSVQGHYETRICAAAQVPAVIAGISEGLAGSSLNAGNYSSAKRSFADGTLRPLWRSACAALSTIVDVPADAELWYDERGIAFLRDDASDLANIAQTLMSTVTSGITAGFEPDDVVKYVNPAWVGMKHTGLTSVQLMPPGSTGEPGGDVDGDGLPDDVPAEPIDFGALRADLGDEDEIERAFDPNQLRIGAGKHGGGRWTRMADFATALLRDWAKGEGSDDPLGEHDFSSTQLQSILRDLRKTHAEDPARVKRLTPPRGRAGMTERQKVDQLKTVLYKDVQAHVRGNRDSDVGPRQAKFTLQGKELHDKDVAVYRDPDGKPALFFESDSGQRGALVERFDSLDELHAWAQDNEETRLAEWADKERGGKAPAKKAAPRKAAPKADLDSPAPKRLTVGELGRMDQKDIPAAVADGRLDRQTAVKTLRTRSEFWQDTLAMDPHNERAAELAAEADRLADELGTPLPAPAKRATKSAPEPAPDAPDVDSLRQLGDPEAIRDALDLRKVDELKAMLGAEGLAKSGRKRELVDRLVGHLGGGEAANPPTQGLLERLNAAKTRAEADTLLDGLTVKQLDDFAATNDLPLTGRTKQQKRDDIVNLLVGSRGDSAAMSSVFTEQAARDRQVKLDRVRSVAESLAEVDELASSQATPRALQSRIRSRAKANGLPDATRDELLHVSGDRDALNAELDRIATSHGLTRVTGPAGTVEPFDPERHEWLGERPEPGTPVTILRPGYDADVDGENVRAAKATVQEAGPVGTSGQTRATGADLSGSIDYEALPIEFDVKTGADPSLGEILRRQGFDGAPTVVSAAEFDAAVKRGEVRETWRGLHAHHAYPDLTPDQMAEEYRTGSLRPGNGINGHGTYVAMRREDGEYYGRTLLRIGLRRDARVISADDLDAEMDAYFARAPQSASHRSLERQLLADLAKAKSPRARANIRRQYRSDTYGPDRRYRDLAIQRDPGRFAALRGYDAIEIPKQRSPDHHAEIIILNRTATIVQEAQ